MLCDCVGVVLASGAGTRVCFTGHRAGKVGRGQIREGLCVQLKYTVSGGLTGYSCPSLSASIWKMGHEEKSVAR